jgi:hypothetical protein
MHGASLERLVQLLGGVISENKLAVYSVFKGIIVHEIYRSQLLVVMSCYCQMHDASLERLVQLLGGVISENKLAVCSVS